MDLSLKIIISSLQVVLMVLAAMKFRIAIAIIMLTLPELIFKKIWRIPRGKSKFYDGLDILTSSTLWLQYVKDYPDQFLVIKLVMQICYMVNIIFFTRACKTVMKNRFKHRVIVVVEWLSVCFLLRLALTVVAPVEFALTVCTTGTTFIYLMKVLCEPARPPFLMNEAVLFVNGVISTIIGGTSSDMFILIPNLLSGLLGLVLLVFGNVN